MIAPHAIQRHPSNAQPRLRVLHSGCRRACWAMMMRQARRSSAIQHYTVRCGFLSQRSYVAPSRQRRSSSKRPRKELTYCPIYGFKSFLICAKELTPALFCFARAVTLMPVDPARKCKTGSDEIGRANHSHLRYYCGLVPVSRRRHRVCVFPGWPDKSMHPG